MEKNLIPNLRFVNDRNEVLKVNTQEVVIMINGKILLRNSFDLTEQLQKIYKDAKSVKLYLNYTYTDENESINNIRIKSGLENETLVEISKSIKDLTKTIAALIGTEVK